MARAIWSGNINFGLLTVPVKLYGATEQKDIAFHNLHRGCGSRIKMQRTCPVHDGLALEMDDLERGYEYSKNTYITVSDTDLAGLPLPTKRTIELTTFVDAADVDRIYTEKAYFLEPEPVGAKAYQLLAQALEQKQVMGVGKVALRSKERMCTLRAYQGVLILETLFWPDEIRPLASGNGFGQPPISITQPELDMAYMLVESFFEPFDPAKYSDGYRAALLELIEAKRAGTDIPAADEPPPIPANTDLMAQLKATLEAAKNRPALGAGGVPEAAPANGNGADTPEKAKKRRGA